MDLPALELWTERLLVQVPPITAAGRMAAYCRRNREHLAMWEPPRPDDYYVESFWARQLAGARDEFEHGVSMRTVLTLRDDDAADRGMRGPVIGVVNLSQIVRGGFQAGVIGYSLDAEHQGHGLMSEALTAVAEYAFHELGLHRLMANYRPENERSARVLERLGFEREGYAKEYLYIDGAWRDHVLTSLLKGRLLRPERWERSASRARRGHVRNAGELQTGDLQSGDREMGELKRPAGEPTGLFDS